MVSDTCINCWSALVALCLCGVIQTRSEPVDVDDDEQSLPRGTRSPPNAKDTPAYRLHRYLLSDYKREVRPIKAVHAPIEVGVYVYLYQTINVDQKTNTIQLTASFELYWTDEYLTWDTARFGGIGEIFLPGKKIWTPEISAYYGVESNRMLKHYTDLRVNHTGHVRYFMPFMLKNLCHIDVKYFPFDKQSCTLSFGPWAYQSVDLVFYLLNDQADTTDYYDNQEWLLESTSNNVTSLSYSYLGQSFSYSSFSVEVHMQRQSFYYVFNLVIPTSIITFVSLFGFHMPGSSSQTRDAKFRLGIMTILSMTMLLLAIVDDMPKFSMGGTGKGKGHLSSVPLIGIYYFSNLAIIGLGTVTSSLFVALERKVRQKEVPWCLAWLAWRPKLYNHVGAETGCLDENVITNESVTRKISTKSLKAIATAPPTRSISLDKRLSKCHFNEPDLAIVLSSLYRELLECLSSIERQVIHMRHELYSFMPKNAVPNQWILIINRLEWFSFGSYMFAVLLVLFLFFNHDWY